VNCVLDVDGVGDDVNLRGDAGVGFKEACEGLLRDVAAEKDDYGSGSLEEVLQDEEAGNDDAEDNEDD
jgi:hypothetical protein